MITRCMLVDSHCHLNFPDFKDDLTAVIARAKAQGVAVMQTVCTEMEEFEDILSIAEAHEGIYCSLGVHPNESALKRRATLDEIVKKSTHPKVIGLGETGLDYHYDQSAPETQRASFLLHIEAARITGLPLIIHAREADDDMRTLLITEMSKGAFRGVLHCFTSGRALAETAIELGLYISFSGILTFKNAEDLRAIARELPLERLLVETDAPFLAPLPFRGKRNEPAYTTYTLQKLAEVRGIAPSACAEATTDNFFTLFSKAPRPC